MSNLLSFFGSGGRFGAAGALLFFGALSFGQLPISSSAYRVLGQQDFRENGLNRVEGIELLAPSGVALYFREGAARIYISDTKNHRVLGWSDVRSYQAGDAPTLVLGQPSLRRSAALGIGTAGFNNPAGLAVDPANGNLYVADTGNHRVLRFPNPFANPNRVEPDAVYGQPGFQTNAAGVGRGWLNGPMSVAFDVAGNLWIADTGNHRVLRFSAAILDSPAPEADLVMGQKDFDGNARNRGAATISASGFDRPLGIAFDRQNNLYVSDARNARVLRFAPPFTQDLAATGVYGQAGFTSGNAPAQEALILSGPAGLAVRDDGTLYVAVPADNRVMVFNAAAPVGSPAAGVLGQPDFGSTAANSGVFPRAAAHTLWGPSDVKADPFGNVYVADSGNHRVLTFAGGARSASKVWGQLDFSSNGANQVKPGSLGLPHKLAIDYSQEPYALYVADTANSRVLIWRDAVRFRSGDAADMVIGQPDLRSAAPNEDTPGGRRPSRASLSSPRGVAVDSQGNLWVADTDNHRVLRFPRPVDQGGRATPDVVLGQTDFTSSVSAAVSAFSLRQPSAVVLAPDDTIFVSDTGNNRVVEYAPGTGSGGAAVRVYGQPGFFSAVAHAAPSPQTLNAPVGIAVDASFNLYVADTGSNRVVVFPNTRDAPPNGAAAFAVLGNSRFDTVARGAGASRFQNPIDVAVSQSGDIYVADSGNHRILVFPSLLFLPITDAAAAAVLGQRDLTTTSPNANSRDGQATADALAVPTALYVDRRDTLYVSDAGNSRVLHFLRAATARHTANGQASTLPRGGMVSVEGFGLSDEEASSAPPLAATLAGREVVINDELRAPLASVSPDRISMQVPSAAPTGTQRLAVRLSSTGELLAGGAISIGAYSPGLSARVLNQDGSVNSDANPAQRGSTIRLIGAGQGPVTPVLPDGEAAAEGQVKTVAVPTSNGNTCLTSQPSVCVAVGNVFGDIQFSGLAANAVGIWQIDVKIPTNAPSGAAVPLRAVINAIPTNIINVAIR